MPVSDSTSCGSGNIVNCKTYTSATSTTYTAECSVCKEGYGLENGLCSVLPL